MPEFPPQDLWRKLRQINTNTESYLRFKSNKHLSKNIDEHEFEYEYAYSWIGV